MYLFTSRPHDDRSPSTTHPPLFVTRRSEKVSSAHVHYARETRIYISRRVCIVRSQSRLRSDEVCLLEFQMRSFRKLVRPCAPNQPENAALVVAAALCSHKQPPTVLCHRMRRREQRENHDFIESPHAHLCFNEANLSTQ